MAASDSEDFESADESLSSMERKDRKKRQSSSNYSESSEHADFKLASKDKPAAPIKDTTDGWDDFDIEEEQPKLNEQKIKSENINPQVDAKTASSHDTENKNRQNKEKKTQDTGWDAFDDWGDGGNFRNQPKAQKDPSPDIKTVADRLSAVSVKEEPKSSGWGWGSWGVDSILSSASAGLSTIGSHVSQGITNVLETGIGIPDPEELARKNKNKENDPSSTNQEVNHPNKEDPHGSGDADTTFQLGSLISGVTKFVETTGSKVITGGLDTLETIGKKTMEVLQDGDPGLVRKRALLGLDTDKVVLSQVLREAKAKADEEDRLKEEKREAKEVHYETLFDDFEGLVHLEALEMLSKQVSMRIEERLRTVDAEKRQEIKETLQQVAELCEMPDEDDDDDDDGPALADEETFHERLQEATQDLGLKLQFQPLIKQYTDTLSWLKSEASETEKAIYKKCVGSLAHHTALSVELYHKAGEMLLVKTRRSTADEADALTQMTTVLTKHISELATRFTEKLSSIQTDNKEQINTYITNVFLEAGNSSSYIQNAFQLALPILQIGAV